MNWWGAGVTALLVVAAFWLPGFTVLAAWGWRGPWTSWAALAPAVTLGVLAPGAILLDGLARWTVVTALALVAVVAVPVALVRRARPSTRYERTWPFDRGLLACVATGAVAQLVPFALGMGRPGRLLTAHDTIVHLNGIAHIRATGSGSSLTFNSVSTLSGAPSGFYGAAWHDVVALLPAWPDASTTFNTALAVPFSCAWTVGVVYLTQKVWPARPRVWRWAAVLSAAGVALPLYLTLRPEGMAPNAMGVALVPAALAVVLGSAGPTSRTRAAVAAVVLVGVGLCHPNALLATLLVLAPWAVASTWRAATSLQRPIGSRVAVGAGVAAVAVIGCVGLAVVARTATFHAVVAWEPEPADPVGIAVVQVLSTNPTGMGWATGLGIGVAAVAGAVMGWRIRPARWAIVGCATAVAWYLAATSSIPVLTDVDRPWYGEPRRFAPVLAATMVPLAALAFDSVWRWLRVLVVRSGRTAAAALALVVAVVAVPGAVAAVGLADLTRFSFAPKDDVAVADDAELAMLRRLPDELDPRGAVLGSPFSGAAHLYALSGLDAVPRTMNVPEDSDLRYIDEHLDDLGHDAELCAALAALHVRYLYVDPEAWNTVDDVIDVRVAPAHGARLVDSGGSATVLEITACA